MKPRQARKQLHLVCLARLAEETGIDLLVIGTELYTATDESDDERTNPKAAEFWSRLIDEIREIYSGKLTYSTACWIGKCDGINCLSFWSKLDFIGLEPYFALWALTDKGDSFANRIAGQVIKKWQVD